MLLKQLVWCALLLVSNIPLMAHAASRDCASLAGANFQDTHILSAELRPAGVFTIPALGPLPARTTLLPAFCRIKGTIEPNIGFELWLPSGHWNVRLLSLGSGGFGGFIDGASLATYLKEGYAVTANDTGHRGTGTAWMHDPQALLAWGHDATHNVIGPSKAIVAAFYGKPAAYSYFQGCSTGGAQAMEEAEYFPDDFSGIVAESPGMYYSHLMLSFLWGLKSASDGALLSDAKLQFLHKAVLDECDAEDGLKDGLLQQPAACHVDLSNLICRSGGRPDCLTRQEAKTAEMIYSGPRNPHTGAEIYPGFVPGSEADQEFVGKAAQGYGWTLIQGPLATQYAVPLLANMVFGKNWNWKTFDWDRDVARVDQVLGTKIDAMNPDLESFYSHGGKLVMVQGWGDPFNAQTLPIEYRSAVIARFAASNGEAQSRDIVDSFYRLFMAPGMSHCIGGPGPSKVDALSALRAWVEHNRAPTRLIAQKVDFLSQRAGPAMRRPLCPYPDFAHYIGGDINRPESFRCGGPISVHR